MLLVQSWKLLHELAAHVLFNLKNAHDPSGLSHILPLLLLSHIFSLLLDSNVPVFLVSKYCCLFVQGCLCLQESFLCRWLSIHIGLVVRSGCGLVRLFRHVICFHTWARIIVSASTRNLRTVKEPLEGLDLEFVEGGTDIEAHFVNLVVVEGARCKSLEQLDCFRCNDLFLRFSFNHFVNCNLLWWESVWVFSVAHVS